MTTMTISGRTGVARPDFEQFVAARSAALLRTAYLLTGTGGGGGSRQLVPPGTVTSMRFSTPPERVSAAGLALYRRVG